LKTTKTLEDIQASITAFGDAWERLEKSIIQLAIQTEEEQSKLEEMARLGKNVMDVEYGVLIAREAFGWRVLWPNCRESVYDKDLDTAIEKARNYFNRCQEHQNA
jgi:hypothetical protein